ncbi:DUF805 domain-containing protein [Erythrobacter sp. THAF29]|uniref:DUF805 domain-containing protein n=1 Tax=Erythrobacter sp. THAF29 TaxID=2587851 RepID=UPI0012A7DA72|nr:DUF805 domain-containing protein [Erythrobacter sp. THAF29]QFT77904.1 hypothetical protein FIU90_10185 [Erythrobacter sp. THAF29]
MLNSIKYNLSHLTDFSGRDARQTFWFYVLFLVIVNFAIGLISSIPLYIGMAGQLIDAASSGSSGADRGDEIAAGMVESMSGYIETQAWIAAAVAVVMVGLLLASFVRRLHDGGFPGWIAAIPVATQLFTAVYNIMVVDDVIAIMGDMMKPENQANAMAMQAEVAPYSWVAWIGYLVVIGFGVVGSNQGPNKYGGEPVRH